MKFKSWLNKAGEMGIGKVIGVILVMLVGLALLPTLLVSMGSAKNNSNADTATKAIIGLIGLFFALGLGVYAVMWVVKESHQGGE